MTANSYTHPHLECVSNVNDIHLVRHYIYSHSEVAGKSLANQLREQGFDVEDRLEDDGDCWLVRVKQLIVPSDQEITESRKFFEVIAAEYNAVYDDWDVKIQSETSDA